jgi:hypothetical protein
MRKTKLGRTGIEVSPIAFGTWQLGGDWDSFDDSAAIEAIRHARELGLVRDSSPAWLRAGVVVVDGKIRHFGVSNFDAPQMSEFSRTQPVETLRPPYHLFPREIEADVLLYAREHDIGVLVYGPLAHGLLTGTMDAETTFADDDWRSRSPLFGGDEFRTNLGTVVELSSFAAEWGATVAELAIAWALANPSVQMAIVGTRQPRHIEHAVAAADLELDADDLARIEQIMSGAVAVAGPSPEAV